MKQYTKAQLSVVMTDAEDILTASTPDGTLDDTTENGSDLVG